MDKRPVCLSIETALLQDVLMEAHLCVHDDRDEPGSGIKLHQYFVCGRPLSRQELPPVLVSSRQAARSTRTRVSDSRPMPSNCTAKLAGHKYARDGRGWWQGGRWDVCVDVARSSASPFFSNGRRPSNGVVNKGSGRSPTRRLHHNRRVFHRPRLFFSFTHLQRQLAPRRSPEGHIHGTHATSHALDHWTCFVVVRRVRIAVELAVQIGRPSRV